MNICVFTKTLLKGGAEKQSVLLSSILANNFNVILVSWHGQKKNNYSEYTSESSFKTFLLNGNPISKFINLIKIIKQNRIDVIFSYLLTTNIIASFIGKYVGVKFIVGGIRSVYHPYWKEKIMKYLHNHVTTFTIANCITATLLLKSKGFNAEKLVVIPNGIKPKELFIGKIFQSEIKILTVGRFVKEKDYLTAIKTINYLKYHLMHNSPYHIKYYIVGYGELRSKIENEIAKRKLNNVIEIVDDSDLEKLYMNADIYLCTSIYEGISNSILEAMNNSLPVVATNAGDNIYLVENAKNGFICNTKDWKSIANYLYILIRYPEFRVKMGRESYKKIEDEYSLKIFAMRYCKLLDQMQKIDQNNKSHFSFASNSILAK